MITHSNLHYAIIRYIIDHGFAPDSGPLAGILKSDIDTIEEGLRQLQEYHGVVLHPHEPKIWVIHPFSLAPTNFLVQSKRGSWWGNCAWCSLGVSALLDEDVRITTSYGAHGEQVEIHIIDGQVQQGDLLIHFPIPMMKAWDNVMYTCSTMLVFRNEDQIDEWTRQHNIDKGDIQPISKIWKFSKVWYGDHLDQEWKKWTIEEAKGIFEKFGLDHNIWQLGDSEDRF